jgi:hypothetical protein
VSRMNVLKDDEKETGLLEVDNRKEINNLLGITSISRLCLWMA